MVDKNRLSMECCAKTNLYLHVAGKRPDNFHEIETVFWPVKYLTDHLEIDFSPGRVTDKIQIISQAPGMPLDSSNLCWKAAESYFEAAGIPLRPLTIHLEKKIPIAGGMGGGSSDCAGVLLLMEEYFGALGKEKLAALALALGSDVPFFLHSEPAIGRGRGEKLEKFSPAENLTLPLLFASPLFPVSAAWTYNNLDYALCGEKSPSLASCLEALDKGDISLLQNSLRNDLAPAVFRKYPILSILKEKMEESGGRVLLSGSGPTLFALYRDEEALKLGREKLSGIFRECRINIF